MSIKDNMSEEDYLKKHLSGIESKSEAFEENVKVTDAVITSELNFFTFDCSELPCGRFYPIGSILKVRPAEVKEIQYYSMVNEKDPSDVIEKINYMLQTCVRIKYSDGRIGSFLELKDQDRIYILFLIRELTFQQGNSLNVGSSCTCGESVSIELKRGNFKFHEIDSKLEKFYQKSKGIYHFETVSGESFTITPPNIGLQKAFVDYVNREYADNNEPNMAFLKIIPFTLVGRTSITYDGIKSKLEDFQKMTNISFQFLNSAINKMTFGIKELGCLCSCGEEVTTEMQLPNGFGSIFVIHDAFEAYIKE